MWKKIVAWLSSVFAVVWVGLNALITYATLPEDLEELWKENMMGQPLLPYILLGLGFVMLLWVYFPAWRGFFMTEKQNLAGINFDQSLNVPGSNNQITYSPQNTFNVSIDPQLETAGLPEIIELPNEHKIYRQPVRLTHPASRMTIRVLGEGVVDITPNRPMVDGIMASSWQDSRRYVDGDGASVLSFGGPTGTYLIDVEVGGDVIPKIKIDIEP